eukprot:68036_1
MAKRAWSGCDTINPASWWIHYIFTQNAAALSILLILYLVILTGYILYNQQLQPLSAFNDFIDKIANAFQRTSFHRRFYAPYIHYYISTFALFISLFIMSFMYFDSLFHYINDCTTTFNSWCVFSILFLIQFWYKGIQFILFSFDFAVPALMNKDSDTIQTNTDATIIGEVEDTFVTPSVPSMNAPMQNALDDDYEEQDRGAIAEYNPFDSDNDDNDRTDYVVVDQGLQAPIMQDTPSQVSQPPPPPPPHVVLSPPPVPLPPPDVVPTAPFNEYMDNEPVAIVKTTDYGNIVPIQQIIKYFKHTTIFFMILSIFAMVTSWKFIPYYVFDIASFTMFYPFIAPFVLIYRTNNRFMKGDYYTHDHAITIINDLPLLLFLLKISSLFIVLNYCMTLSVSNASILPVLLYVILPLCCLYPWKVLCQISSPLEYIYANMKRGYFDENGQAFLPPILPFGGKNEGNASLIEENRAREQSLSMYSPYDPPEAGRMDRLESVELSVADHPLPYEDIIPSTDDRTTVQKTISYYGAHRFWIVHIVCAVNVFISFIAGLESQSLIIYCVLLLLTVLYAVFVTLYPAAQSSNQILRLIGYDTKQRLFVFLATNLLLSQLNMVLVTELGGVKFVFTILYLVSSVMLGVLTFDKSYKDSYKALLKIPVKYPKMYARSCMVSYVMSIVVLCVWMIHGTAVNKHQSVMIYQFIWWMWCQLYHNELYHFVTELKLNVSTQEAMPSTYGSLYLLNELLMVSSFVAFVICCAMAAKSYHGAQDGASVFFLAVYLVLSLVVFVNTFVAILSMQPPNQKGYKAAVFEPVLKESLLTQDL